MMFEMEMFQFIVGRLTVTYIDEPTRFQIRTLYSILNHSAVYKFLSREGKQFEEFKMLINQIIKKLPDEVCIQELQFIGYSPEIFRDLCKGIVQNEIDLSIQ